MSKTKDYIRENTRNYGNVCSYNSMECAIPWLTTDDARKVAEIAREETIKEMCEWLDNHTMLSEKWYIEDLKKHLNSKL